MQRSSDSTRSLTRGWASIFLIGTLVACGGGGNGDPDAGPGDAGEDPHPFERGVVYYGGDPLAGEIGVRVVDIDHPSVRWTLFQEVDLPFHELAISPDGATALLSTGARGSDGEGNGLYTSPIGGGGPVTTLVSSQEGFRYFRDPFYDPTGEHVYFSALDEEDSWRIGRIAADGSGGPAYLTPAGAARAFFWPSLDRDGNLYVAAGGADLILEELGRLDRATGAYTPLVTDLGDARSVFGRAEVSPDGAHIAFTGVPSGGPTGIYLANLATGAVTRIDLGEGRQLDPTWVDDTHLFYITDHGDNAAGYVVERARIDGSEREQLNEELAASVRFGPR